MAPFQFVPRSSARTNYFFPSIESLPLPTRYPLFLRSLFSRGGPISLIVGPLKGDEKEDDGEREREERQRGREGARDKKGDIDLISGRDRQWCRCRSLLRSLSPHRPIYLSIASSASVPNKKKSNAPLQKSEGRSPHSLPFAVLLLPSSSFVPFGAILIPLTKSP